MADGWVKLHRQMLEWEWWDDHNTCRLFLVMILKANHKDTKWRGQVVKKGQILTGRKQLSEWSGLSEQSVRTSLKNLQKTNEVTIKSTKQYSIITIVNWKNYQEDNQQLTIKSTNDQPTTNQQLTTSKNDNNDNNDKNVNNSIIAKITELFVLELNGYVQPIQNLSRNAKDSLIDAHFELFKSDFENWKKLFAKVKENDFYLGGGGNGWVITLQWLSDQNKIVKILNEKPKKKIETKIDDELDGAALLEKYKAKAKAEGRKV